VGFGETLLYYTWGVTQDNDVERVRGKNAADVMWDDELGAGLQMALFDAVARAADVPVHRLLGNQVADKTPLSWWNIDMATDDMLSECQEAYRQGYLAYKTKGRPWFDLWDQVETVVKKLPAKFKVDMDFNDTLLDAKRGIPILKELEQYPHIDIYETPIPQGDIAGNQAICKATRVSIAMHYGNPDPFVALRNDICDGFIIGGGASRLMKRGSVCEMADKPFWLQLVGTGITAAWSLHFGAVLSHATWPAVNCHQLYQHQLLKTPIRVKKGFAAIPSGPGLGYELDQEAVARYRVPKPAQRPDPPRLIETTWKDGRTMYTANTGSVNFMLKPGMVGKIPYYERGVQTRLLPNDGSARWKKLYQASRQGPVVYKP
jgi:galactonate dehydratase